MKLKNKLSDFSIICIGCYIPPENSVYAQGVEETYGYLVSMVYELYDEDMVLIMGDFNARLGTKPDVIDVIDNVPSRNVIDDVHNDHGAILLDFLIQTKCCVINGRVDPLKDGFTSVSTKGKAVVDYIITRHDALHYVRSFSVRNVSDIINELNIQDLAHGRVSEHAFLGISISAHTHGTENDRNMIEKNSQS